MIKPAVYLKTRTGINYYWAIQKMFTENSNHDKMVLTLKKELNNVSRIMSDFLSDAKVETDSYWKFYDEEFDKYTALNYFIQRKSNA